MKIIASDGPSRFLVDLERTEDDRPMGQVVDTRRGIAHPPRLLPSLLTRGNWEDCQVDAEAERVIIAACQPIEPPK